MSDPYIMRDGEGNPLSSIFHKPPSGNDIYFMESYSAAYEFDPIHIGLKKLADAIFKPEPITEFHPDDMKGDEEE